MVESYGLMVNYLYDLDQIEENHEAYANRNEVVSSPAVRKLARGKPREIREMAAESGSARS
jgi:malonyl-CoA decarboxylase